MICFYTCYLPQALDSIQSMAKQTYRSVITGFDILKVTCVKAASNPTVQAIYNSYLKDQQKYKSLLIGLSIIFLIYKTGRYVSQLRLSR